MSDTTSDVPTIERIELHRLEVPLVRPFETSFGRETVREVLLVHVLTDAGEGWGECVAGRDPFYSGEYVDGAASVIERYLAPALLDDRARAQVHAGGGAAPQGRATDAAGAAGPDGPGRRGASVPLAASVAPTLAFVAGHRMAKGALEAAVLDAELRAQGRSMAELFGAMRDWVDCGVSVGIADRPSTSCSTRSPATSRRATAASSSRSSPGWDLVPVGAVRELLGPAGCCRSTRTPPTRPTTSRCSRARRVRPAAHRAAVRRGRPRRARALAEACETPVCLDESILDAGRGRRDRSRRVPRGEHQAGPHGRLPRGAARARRVPRRRRAGLVRRHARDRGRARGQRRARGTAGLHPAGRHLGVATATSPRTSPSRSCSATPPASIAGSFGCRMPRARA